MFVTILIRVFTTIVMILITMIMITKMVANMIKMSNDIFPCTYYDDICDCNWDGCEDDYDNYHEYDYGDDCNICYSFDCVDDYNVIILS